MKFKHYLSRKGNFYTGCEFMMAAAIKLKTKTKKIMKKKMSKSRETGQLLLRN